MSLMILNFNTALGVISYCILRAPDIKKKNPVYKNQRMGTHPSKLQGK
jgi:hypothetical protein